ncbi:SDR family NAD(P)-dependent oxidoreductase [Mesorhizobium sp. M0410]|uniref:SDR family NAD(P)-dependent oxidoreductase n=1 Tax=Mesorhizobium sp. M0410 TaxID=2956943 RepID=UPI0033366C45
MGSLQGQNVVVVGGSRGVGRSIAEAALKERATVLAVARGKQALAQFAWEVSGVKTLVVDATVDSAPDKVFAALEPDVLVICAGAGPFRAAARTELEGVLRKLGHGRQGIVPVLPGRSAASAQAGNPYRSDLQWRGLDRRATQYRRLCRRKTHADVPGRS